jgi:hypothetical protein
MSLPIRRLELFRFSVAIFFKRLSLFADCGKFADCLRLVPSLVNILTFYFLF